MPYYKTVIEVEVLNEGVSPFLMWNTLTDLDHEIMDGGCSGMVSIKSTQELTVEECAEALLAQGSDPDFLILEEDLKHLEE